MKTTLRPLLVLTWALGLVVVTGCGDDDAVGPTNKAPAVTLTSPNGGETVAPGGNAGD